MGSQHVGWWKSLFILLEHGRVEERSKGSRMRLHWGLIIRAYLA